MTTAAMIAPASTPPKVPPAADRGGRQAAAEDDFGKLVAKDERTRPAGHDDAGDDEAPPTGWKLLDRHGWHPLAKAVGEAADAAGDAKDMPGAGTAKSSDEDARADDEAADALVAAMPQAQADEIAEADAADEPDLPKQRGSGRGADIAASVKGNEHAVAGRMAADAPARGATAQDAAAQTPEMQARTNETGRPAAMLAGQAVQGAAENGRAAEQSFDAADRAAPKITVVSSQVSPAPASVPLANSLSPTGAAFAASLAADPAMSSYVDPATQASLARPGEARPVAMLTIQLQPVELGTVTARLTGSGEQLSIEIQVENNEARHRLATDSDTIVKSLRAMGYDIDRITVQQTQQATIPQGGAPGRDSGFSAQDGRGSARDEQSGQRHDGNGQNGREPAGGHRPGERTDPAGSGVYI